MGLNSGQQLFSQQAQGRRLLALLQHRPSHAARQQSAFSETLSPALLSAKASCLIRASRGQSECAVFWAG